MGKRLSLLHKSDRNDDYSLLRFRRPGEKIVRVDKYTIMMYWDEYNQEGNPVVVNEMMFYPSEFGINEIDNFAKNDMIIDSKKVKTLVHRLDQLRKYGNPWWHKSVDYVLTPENWQYKDPKISSFQEIDYVDTTTIPSYSNKPKRLKLRTK